MNDFCLRYYFHDLCYLLFLDDDAAAADDDDVSRHVVMLASPRPKKAWRLLWLLPTPGQCRNTHMPKTRLSVSTN
jgi:hypothetical protein